MPTQIQSKNDSKRRSRTRGGRPFLSATVLTRFILVMVITLIFWGCQEAGTGEPVSMPQVQLRCTTGTCASTNGSRFFTVIITQAGCASTEFSGLYSASGFVNCSGGQCQATTTGWVDRSSNMVTTIPASNYDFCSVIFINGSGSSGGSIVTGDMVGGSENVSVNSSLAALGLQITSWVQVP